MHAEANALTAQADAIGIDTYAILDDIARTYADANQDQYNAAARDALAAAIARSNQDGGGTAAQTASAAEPAQEPGLTAPTRADIEAQQEARDKAEREEATRQRVADQAASQDENRKRIAQASVRAADTFELGQSGEDNLSGQGGLKFSRAGNYSEAELTVKETIDQNHTNPLYTVEAVEFNEKSPAAQWVDASASADGVDLTSTRSARDVESLAQRACGFQLRWPAHRHRHAVRMGRPNTNRLR